MSIRLTFVGSGDSFGSGGRLQTCLHLSGAAEDVLIDCGTSSLIGMKRLGLDPSAIAAVLVSHVHVDHFGGVPFLVLDGQFRRRTRSLVVAAPPTARERYETAMELFFPGSMKITRRFTTDFVETRPGVTTAVGPARVTPYAVEHASGAPSYALRVEYGGKTITYSGDTEWTDRLLDAARGADVFVCEAYSFERPIRYHLDYRSIAAHLDQLECRRIVLTHMGPDVLERQDEIALERADDGLVVTL